MAVHVNLYSQSPVTWQPTAGPNAGVVYNVIQTWNGTIFAGCDSGGVFSSTDGGVSWNPLNNGLTDVRVRALAAGGTFMVAGTSSGAIFVSTDNGGTWNARQTLPSGITSAAISTTLIMYAGTSGHGLYASTDFGFTWLKAGIEDQFTGYNFTGVSAIHPMKNGKMIFGFFSIPGMVYSAPPGFTLPWVYQFSGDSKYYSFAAGVNGIVILGGNGFVSQSLTEFPFNGFTGGGLGLPKISVTAVASDTGGRLFAGTNGSGIYESVHEGQYWKPANSGLNAQSVYSLLSAKDGYAYAGTNDGMVYKTTAPTATMLAPALSTPYDTVVNHGQVRLQWLSRKGAQSYRILVSHDSLFSSAHFFDGTVQNDTAILITNLDSVSTYFWKVRGENPQVTTEYSLVRRFITGPPPSPPELLKPADDSVGVPPGWITFTWNSVPNAVEYHLSLESTSPYGAYGSVKITTDTTAALYINERETPYEWKVKAANIAGYGAFSLPFTLTMVENPPFYPVLIAPANYATKQPVTVTFSWHRRPNVHRHKIRVGTKSDFTSGIIYLDSTIVDTTVTIGNFIYETRYYWQVFGINDGGTGNGSEVYMFTTGIGPPTIPTGLLPADGSAQQPLLTTLKWNPAARADSYYVWITIDTTDWIRYGDAAVAYSPQITGYFDPGKTYYWRIAAVNATGMSGWTAVQSFTTGGAHNIDRIPAPIPAVHGLSQNYPNPFNAGTSVTVDLPDYQYITLKIYSVNGVEITTLLSELLSPGSYRVYWTPDNIASGIYFCRMQTVLSHFSSGKEFVTTRKLLYVK